MNDRNYPNFTRLLDRLGVARQPTHMSFSVKGEEPDFEFSGTPRGLFCQPGNLVSPRFQRMIVDLLRFNRALRGLLEHEESGESMHDFLARHRFSRAFIERLIVPAAFGRVVGRPAPARAPSRRASSPSSSPTTGCSASATARSWSTVAGGSARYVEALTRALPRPHPAERAGQLGHAPRRTCARSSPPTCGDRELRPGDHRHALRSGAAHAARRLRSASTSCSARSPTSPTRPCCTPTARCCPAGARRARLGTSTCCASPSR